ncbi:hypothetical protein GF327_03745 [Candidatus Woesearchaeota archaeon]|nr:hypothetical protein [Candidatus Woesearchaeota archaeon]
MCRMVIGIGNIDTKKLIDDFRYIAQGKNELHEKNPYYGKLMHDHGWGLAYLNKKNKWVIYKSVNPIYEDKNLKEFTDIDTQALIIHARKATAGNKTIPNTQPLFFKNQDQEFLFAHNGTINDQFDIKTKYLEYGDSDTVMWFNKILLDVNKENEVRIEKHLYSLKNFTSANFFFVTPEKIFVGQYYRKDPKYHTMKLFKENYGLIISSEILPHLKSKNWSEIPNRSIFEIDYKKKRAMVKKRISQTSSV